MNKSTVKIIVSDEVYGGLESNTLSLIKDIKATSGKKLDIWSIYSDGPMNKALLKTQVKAQSFDFKFRFSRNDNLVKQISSLFKISRDFLQLSSFRRVTSNGVNVFVGLKPSFLALLFSRSNENNVILLHDRIESKVLAFIFHKLLNFSNIRVLSIAPQQFTVDGTPSVYLGDRRSEFKTLSVPSKLRKVAIIGGISRNKNQLGLIHVAELLPDIEFISVGGVYESDYKCECDTYISNRSINNFSFLGQTDDMANIYNSVDAVVNLSISEGQPITYYESLFHGVLYLGVDVGYLRNMLNSYGGVILEESEPIYIAKVLESPKSYYEKGNLDLGNINVTALEYLDDIIEAHRD